MWPEPEFLRTMREQQDALRRVFVGAEETHRQITAAFGPMYETLRRTQEMFGLPRLVDAAAMKMVIDVEQTRREMMAPFEQFERTMRALRLPKFDALELPRIDVPEFTLPEPRMYPDLRPTARRVQNERIARLEERVRELEDQLNPPPSPPPADDDPDLHTGVYL